MAAPTAPVMGANGFLAFNTGSYETPTFDEMPNVRDIDWAIDFTDVDVTSRVGDGWKMHEPALADVAFSTEHLYDPADTQLDTLRTSALTRAAVEMVLLDGDFDTQGSQGIRLSVKAFKLGAPQPLDGIMAQAFDWKACYSANPPEYIEIS